MPQTLPKKVLGSLGIVNVDINIINTIPQSSLYIVGINHSQMVGLLWLIIVIPTLYCLVVHLPLQKYPRILNVTWNLFIHNWTDKSKHVECCIFPSGWNVFIMHANSRQAIFNCVHSQTLQLVGSFLDPRKDPSRMNSCRSRTLQLCFSGDCPPSTDDLSTQHTQHVAYLFRCVSFKRFFKSMCPMYPTRVGNLMLSRYLHLWGLWSRSIP